MFYFLIYLLVSAVYSLFYLKYFNIGVFKLILLGATFPLILTIQIICPIFKMLGINIYYMVSLDNKEDK